MRDSRVCRAMRPDGPDIALPMVEASMRNLLFSALLLPLLVAACSSSSTPSGDGLMDGSTDSATCTGTAPLICDGCCGSKYAADDCVDGTWSCRARGGACDICDAGATDSGATDASEDASACAGNPPLVCDGCCGGKYAADECLNGVWSCRGNAVSCPICDAGTKDSAPGDASGDAATCSGTAPLCFGNDTNHCCGNDPAGSASCSGGEWMCGSSLAPGCNGTSCLLHDAGPG
jgi:hypothetical protein